jgi:hypothetical protein
LIRATLILLAALSGLLVLLTRLLLLTTLLAALPRLLVLLTGLLVLAALIRVLVHGRFLWVEPLIG